MRIDWFRRKTGYGTSSTKGNIDNKNGIMTKYEVAAVSESIEKRLERPDSSSREE